MSTKPTKLHTWKAGATVWKWCLSGHKKLHTHEKADRITVVLAAVAAVLSVGVFVSGEFVERSSFIVLVVALLLSAAAAVAALIFEAPRVGLPFVWCAVVVGTSWPTLGSWMPVVVALVVFVVVVELVGRRFVGRLHSKS